MLPKLHYYFIRWRFYQISRTDVPVETVLFNYGWIGSIVSGISALTWGCQCLPKASNQGLLLLFIGINILTSYCCPWFRLTQIPKKLNQIFSSINDVTLFWIHFYPMLRLLHWNRRHPRHLPQRLWCHWWLTQAQIKVLVVPGHLLKFSKQKFFKARLPTYCVL